MHMTKEADSASAATVSPASAGEAGAPEAVAEQILRENIELAKPDDLAFLESQVPYIAARIVRRLRSMGVCGG